VSGLEELRRLETAATPGPWAAQHREPKLPENDPDILAKQRAELGGEQGSNVHHGDPRNPTWGSGWPHRNASADAEFIVAARNQIPRILDALDAVQALHQPVKKWEPYEGAGYTFASEAAALEALGDVDVNSVVLEGIAENGLPFFEVCAECGRIESDQLSEMGEEWGYRESLWPCPTVAAITKALEGDQ
jgi:hypothetical protein